MSIEFFVEGTPRPGGSKRAIYSKKQNRSFIIPDNKHTKPWMETVKWQAMEKRGEGFMLLEGPVKVVMSFVMPRPKAHYRTGKNSHLLKDNAPQRYHFQKPDKDKLERSTLDALTGVIWKDDCQVAASIIQKVWTNSGPGTDGAGVDVKVSGLTNQPTAAP